ncbi:MAG: MotA/TolQ/ExbB proton channel family protein [Deltaproteobacteria bacterium]|nr:MotA/TolQ/ExbB proton channel family protein [Deltaproteobacteria bacterium]MBW2418279.1 MotA/TolQ/ExbB proton channel family protein [Deltaproteobacteria bacterium]
MLVIAFVTVMMWSLIVERVTYFLTAYRNERDHIRKLWEEREDHTSWYAYQLRRMMISQVRLKLTRGLLMIRTIVAVCPMFGLLGTVTGMIEVFDVMAISGSGNTRGMAGGVSRATLPTMAGMVAALSGMIFSIQLERFANQETERLADQLEVRST